MRVATSNPATVTKAAWLCRYPVLPPSLQFYNDMSKTLDLIRNADDSTMVDFRHNNQIDSVPINEIRALPSSIAVTMMQIMDDAGSDHIALKRLDKYAQELKGAIYDDIRSESRPLSESARGVAVEQSRRC